jgi:hypothetical protein
MKTKFSKFHALAKTALLKITAGTSKSNGQIQDGDEVSFD